MLAVRKIHGQLFVGKLSVILPGWLFFFSALLFEGTASPALYGQGSQAILEAKPEPNGRDIYRSIRLGIMIQGKGEALYSWFGHAGIVLSGSEQALRAAAWENRDNFIAAPAYNGEELLFDYGNFDASGKYFVLRFLAGDLSYYKSYKNFSRYKEINSRDYKRGMDVYWLNLDSLAKRRFLQILFRETNPERRVYAYNFYFDNCLTRIRDQLDEVFDGRLKEQISGENEFSIRQILRREIGDKFWGILLLEYLQGVKIDQKYSRWDSLFLPSQMPAFLRQLRIPDSAEPLLVERENIFPFRRDELEHLHTIKYFRRHIYMLSIFALAVLVLGLLFWRRSHALVTGGVQHGVCGRNQKVEKAYLIKGHGGVYDLKMELKLKIRRWLSCICRLSYYVLSCSMALVLAAFSTVLWLLNILQSYDVALNNVFVILGSPFLLLQPLALVFLLMRSARSRALWFMLWNWRIHAGLALVLPLWAWFSISLSGQLMQDILLPWLAISPILLAVVFLFERRSVQ